MSAEVINLNPDLKRLQDEGYEIEIRGNCAFVYNIPYLDGNLDIKKGVIVSPLSISGDTVKYINIGNAHVVYFQGDYPHKANGEKLDAVVHSVHRGTYFGITTNYMFSNKPASGYKNYYEKLVNYINILSNEAKSIDPSVTANTFKRIVSSEKDIMVYSDANASRADILHLNEYFRGQKIAIIGLGGTGSYILDVLAKSPLSEIHLFDGDTFCQHNAFRAPGAADLTVFELQQKKTDYWSNKYKNMHKGIISHPYNLMLDNVAELHTMDYVFISIDSGESKQDIVRYLISQKIPFVDTGIDVQKSSTGLIGTVRITEFDGHNEAVIFENVSFTETDNDIYHSNIQTCEINAFCGILAVLQWKKRKGFYIDNVNCTHIVYDTNDGEFK